MAEAAELTFAVRRRDAELVRPAAPTPRETKRLSDIDGQETVRKQLPILFFYRGRGEPRRNDDDDPALVIRRALGEALVPYYPLAGRLREVEGQKLVVDCTGEGVLFVEADADVRLVELEAASTGPRAPFPWKDRLLSDVEGSSGILNSPLLLIQVTRLLCGGFVFALRLNHTLCDAIGIAQFVSAVGELARGLPTPTVAPAWCRHLLDARSPPTPAIPHHEYDVVRRRPTLPTGGEIVARTFTFTKADIAVLKQGCLPPRLRSEATAFEVLAAVIWRARTAALDLAPDEDVRLAVVANFRGVTELGLPPGYYGNAIMFLMAVTTAGALLAGSVADAVELVREAKRSKTAEHVRSTADFLVKNCASRPYVALGNLFLVSDVRHAGFHRVDFGWGEPAYGGPADTALLASFVVTVKDDRGEDALAVPVELPRQMMDRFASQVEVLLRGAS